MSQFVTLANSLKELGATVVVVAASVWFAFKFLPVHMKQQGEIEEILRNNTAVIQNCTEALRMVTAHSDDAKEVLVRYEKKLEEIMRSQHELALEIKSSRRG